MKAKLSLIVFVIIAFAAMSASPVQPNVRKSQNVSQVSQSTTAGFDFLRLHRQTRDGATITWGMTSEAGVSGYLVQRTYQDPTDPYSLWDNCGSVPCTSSRSYKWTDTGLFPGFVSYRVVAVMSNNGSNIVSDVLTIHISGH